MVNGPLTGARYIVRESATALNPAGKTFGSDPAGVKIPELLGKWQQAGDDKLFKLILSPEFGDRTELERLTRDVMAGIEHDQYVNRERVVSSEDNIFSSSS